MSEKYICQINFIVNLEANDETQAVEWILSQAKAMVSDAAIGFTFKRESDGQVFLAVDGKAVRIPKTMGAPPRL